MKTLSPPAVPARSRPEPVGWRTCRVIAKGDSNWLVQDLDSTRRMRRAVGCLLLPEPGDTVACLCADDGAPGWIVAVLERPAEAGQETPPLRLRVEGDLALEVRGRWDVRATAASVEADTLALSAGTVQTRFDTLRSVGRVLEMAVSRTRWVGQELVAVVDRWAQHAKTSHRQTEGLDRTQAGHLELRAEGVLHTQAQHVLTEGATLVKTRGSQIHFGG